jgi:hypothetical protein
MRVSGLSKDVYLGRWLFITGLLFGASAQLFALRVPWLKRNP